MKLNFKTFSVNTFLTEGVSDFGISHIEDLDIEAFLRVLENIKDFTGVQKLDGSNLRVGLDDKGNLYTSREQKGGLRFYSESNFPKNSAFDGFRAAHAVLEKIEGYILEVLVPGESINLEILYGPQPNTVLYGKDNLNYIALLEMLPGDDPSIDPDQNKISKLMKLIDKKIFVVKTPFSDTTDGKIIARVPNTSSWKFITSDIVPKHEISEINFGKELGALKGFLKRENDVAEKLGIDLTNFEIMKDRNRDLSDERKKVEDKVFNEFKLPIKDKLLELVYKQRPSVRGTLGQDDSNAYKGIEGIIFTNQLTRERFKIVDKDVFSEINKFNYQVRNSIASRIRTTDINTTIVSRGGILGNTKIRVINLFGLQNADMPTQTKKVLEKFKGRDKEETISNITKSLGQLNFQAIKRKIQAIYISGLDDLEDALESFKSGADDYNLQLKNGQTIKYTKEIKRRTLMVFAETRRNIIEILNDVRHCTDMFDLIDIFFKKQLDQMFEKVKSDKNVKKDKNVKI